MNSECIPLDLVSLYLLNQTKIGLCCKSYLELHQKIVRKKFIEKMVRKLFDQWKKMTLRQSSIRKIREIYGSNIPLNPLFFFSQKEDMFSYNIKDISSHIYLNGKIRVLDKVIIDLPLDSPEVLSKRLFTVTFTGDKSFLFNVARNAIKGTLVIDLPYGPFEVWMCEFMAIRFYVTSPEGEIITPTKVTLHGFDIDSPEYEIKYYGPRLMYNIGIIAPFASIPGAKENFILFYS